MLNAFLLEKLQNGQIYTRLTKTLSVKLTKKAQILISNVTGTCNQRCCLELLILILKKTDYKIYLSTEVVIHKTCEKQ